MVADNTELSLAMERVCSSLSLLYSNLDNSRGRIFHTHEDETTRFSPEVGRSIVQESMIQTVRGIVAMSNSIKRMIKIGIPEDEKNTIIYYKELMADLIGSPDNPGHWLQFTKQPTIENLAAYYDKKNPGREIGALCTQLDAAQQQEFRDILQTFLDRFEQNMVAHPVALDQLLTDAQLIQRDLDPVSMVGKYAKRDNPPSRA